MSTIQEQPESPEVNDDELLVLKEQLRRQIQACKQLEQQLHCQHAYFTALHETSLALMNRHNLSELLEIIVSRAAQLVNAPHGYIYLPEGNTFEMKVGIGLLKEQVGFRVVPGEGMGGKVWQTAQPVVVDDYYHWEGRAPAFQKTSLGAVVGVPLLSNGVVAGVLGLAREAVGNRTFNDQDVENLQRFAQLAIIALDNARLYTTLQQELAERTRAEKELQEAKEFAEAANVAKSSFLANMSHELRTPLNAIINYTEMLKEDARDMGCEDAIPDLEKVYTASTHLLEIINDILDLSKIEAGKMETYLEVFEVAAFIDSVTTTIRPLITKNNNILEVVCAESIGTMYSDQAKIRQVLFNLLGNAAKFTEHGCVLLHVTETCKTVGGEQQRWFQFIVSDTGIGMTPDQTQHVFESFIQADPSTTRKYGGTGLGLAISQRLCNMMGGWISVESNLGQGSTFTIHLPSQSREPVDERPEQEDPS